ncbi:stress-responsive transcription factor hsf1 [Tulasnella sp. 403]|nr:stress-responsive transcription factor hsf1 [Tulasnella sp. 403]
MADQLALTRAQRSGLTTNPNRAVRQQIPAFLNKLYSMVNDPETDDLIRWSDEGDSFFVPNHERFGRELLPKYFKHSNFPSFVRQLNMYGFHKVPHLQQGVLQNETETELWQFVSPHFQRGQPDLLMLIQRKKAHGGNANNILADDGDIPHASHGSGAVSGSASHGQDNQVLDVNGIAASLAAIKRHQTTISADLKDLQQSNTALWQEAVAARERHKKHQDTINRILKFLAGVFGTSANGNVAHGELVRHQADGKGPGGGHSGGGPGGTVALIPRKRPRLMIEDGSGNDTPLSPASPRPGQTAAATRTSLEDGDDSDWANEHLLVPMDADDAELEGLNSPNINRDAPQWRENSSAKIESVASPAASNVPPTPRPPVSPARSTRSIPPAQTSQAPAAASQPKTEVISPPTTDSTTYFPANQNPTITPAQLYPYTSNPVPAGQPATAGITAPSIPQNGEISASDQAAFQALLNSPNTFQKLLNAMSQPGGLPVLPQMPPTDSFNQPLQYPSYPPLGNNGMGASFGNNDVVPLMNNFNNSQLVASNPTAFGFSQPSNVLTNYNSNTPGMMGASTGTMNSNPMTSDALLAMLSGQNALSGPTDHELAQTLNSYTNNLSRTYADAATINADVDAVQQSINSLIESMGLDPATLSKLHDDENDQGLHDPQLGATQPMDIDQMIAQYNQVGLNNGSFAGNPDAAAPLQPPIDLAAPTGPALGEPHTEPVSAFLDDAASSSTRSSPNLDMKDDVVRKDTLRTSKRKSDVNEDGPPRTRKSTTKRK